MGQDQLSETGFDIAVGFVAGTAAASSDVGPACAGAGESPLGTGSSDTASPEGAGAAA